MASMLDDAAMKEYLFCLVFNQQKVKPLGQPVTGDKATIATFMQPEAQHLFRLPCCRVNFHDDVP
jgi:hypothetical protein